METINSFIFVPSPHDGPYIKLIQGDSMWIFYEAKLPSGSRFDAPSLDHQEIIKDLYLSQSAASRH